MAVEWLASARRNATLDATRRDATRRSGFGGGGPGRSAASGAHSEERAAFDEIKINSCALSDGADQLSLSLSSAQKHFAARRESSRVESRLDWIASDWHGVA